MMSYERIDKSEGINFEKKKGSEYMICLYNSGGFKYQPYVCNECHDFSMAVQNLKNLFIVTIKNIDYRVSIVGADKKATIYLLSNSILDDKGEI